MGYTLPEMLEAELDHKANDAGTERLIEFFDLVAEQVGTFVSSDKLDVLELELFSGDAVRGVSDEGIEVLIFHHSELDANVLVQRDGFCLLPSAGGAVDVLDKLSYDEIYKLFADGSSLDLPQFDATPRHDEVDDIDDDEALNVLDPEGDPVEIV